MISPCNDLSRDLGSLFTCSPMSNLVRVRTPFTYPDGDFVDVFVEDDRSAVTDLGETLRWLRMQTGAKKRTTKQQSLINSVCESSGIQMLNGQLRTKLDPESMLADAILRVAEACVRVSDISFTYRNRSVISVADEVADFLDENNISYERNAGIQGKSKEVILDFRVPQSNSLIHVISSSSVAATNRIIDHTVRLWYEVKDLDYRCITLLDDSSDVWNSGEIEMLHDFSTVATWSQPKTLLEQLVLAT